jgi:ribonucleoside-diphosphate reductase beta chain
MSDIDVAKNVEAASITQMSDMDIEDVYTLMDVQLRERPGPRELYYRWERQNWSAGDIDLTQDKADWQMLPEMLRNEILGIFLAFFLGEAAVTDTLSPMVHAAPTDEDRQFLSTQLVDEARHTIFFERFFNEVIDMSFEEAKEKARRYGLTHTMDYGYGKVFYVDLVETTEAVREDPSDYGKFVDSIVEYHMLVEGMLALQGQRQILRGARAFNVVPGFRAGFTAVTRDESRHVNYGVYALAEAVKAGLHDRIVQFTSDHMNAIADVNTRSDTEIPMPGPEEIALLEGMLPESVNVDEFIGGGHFPIMQLRKRLKSAGISDDALESLEKQWWARHEQNFNDYEEMFGKPHPIRVRRQQRAEQAAAN